MAASLIEMLKEEARQRRTDDLTFLERHLMFFELRVPSDVATMGGLLGYLFPLILPPKSYQLSEPFTVEVTPTQGGGLYTEENGIVQRRITIQGNTGWRPRPLKLRGGNAFAATLDPAKKSFTRELPDYLIDAVSGQRHFQYLQDAVFRTYADLKRDPATSEDTQLIFHNPKDDEHWLVVPEEFSLERSANAPTLYNYAIKLLVVDKADAQRADFSEDKSLLDSLKDALRTVQQGVAMVSGAINDLTAIVGEIRSVFAMVDDVIDACTSIVDAATDFVNGVSSLIDLPLMFLDSTIALVDSANALIQAHEDLGTHLVQDFPEAARQKFRQLVDGLELIGTHPEALRLPFADSMTQARAAQESRRSLSQTQRDLADAAGTPSTFDQMRARGTLPTPGEVLAADGEQLAGSEVLTYRAARAVRVERGDTLASLAAKYLGDARRWPYIARLNGLRPPFVDSQADAPLITGASGPAGKATGADLSPFPGAVGVGGKILIPTNQQSPQNRAVASVLGADPAEDSVEERYLGTDFALEPVVGEIWSSRVLYDIPIDTEHGAVDAKLVSGISNLKQALRVRLITDRGADILYQQLGAQRVVGLAMTPLDLSTARFRISDAVAADPRVASVVATEIEIPEGEPPDRLVVNMTVAVQGLNQTVGLPVEV
jgi:nucleoid-associated protein YgaU